MPTETGTAFLVDPMGHAPEALDKHEFECVQQFLHVLRSDNEEPLRGAIEWLLHRATTDTGHMNDTAVLEQMLFHYANGFERANQTIGVLARVFGRDGIKDLSEKETETLQHTLSALRTEGWFPEWLKLQVGIIATGTHPDDRYPAPLKVAASLGACIQEHEERMEAARDMVRMRPDLLFPVPVPEPQVTPEPPAVPQATQRIRKGTTGHPRARKSRKKVANA